MLNYIFLVLKVFQSRSSSVVSDAVSILMRSYTINTVRERDAEEKLLKLGIHCPTL